LADVPAACKPVSLTLRYKQHVARALVVSREREAAQVEGEIMFSFDRYATLSWRLKEPGSDDILDFIFNLGRRSFSDVNVTNCAVLGDIKTHIQNSPEAQRVRDSKGTRSARDAIIE
jgi:hypothetical protein